MSETLNMFDLVFIFSSLIILLFAFFRGFVRELFSLINWAIAILLVSLASPYVSKLFSGYIGDKIVSNIVGSSLIFIVIFIISSLLTRRFANILKEKIPYTTDQVLGVVYGFLKIFLIFGIVYSASVNLHSAIYGADPSSKSKESMPSWLYNSKFKGVISPFGEVLDPIVKKLLNQTQERYMGPKIKSKIEKSKKEVERKKIQQEESEPFQIFQKRKKQFEEIQEDEEPIGIINFEKKSKKIDEKYEETGYSKKQIEKLNRLIEIVE